MGALEENSSLWTSPRKLPMEPPTGFWASLLSFLKFLPYFCGLLILGFIKGDLQFCFFSLLISIHAFSSFD